MSFFFAALLLLPLASSDKDSNIFNGQDAKEGQFPYHVGLSMKDIYMCGGALIYPTFVITAAHCFDGSVSEYIVYLGSIQLKDGMTRVPRSMIIYSNYNPQFYLNDIALLEIDEVTYSDNIKIIDLPDIGSNTDYDNHFAISSGWGYTNTSNVNPTILQYTKLEVISNDECSLEPNGDYITTTNLCAVDDESTLCRSDSGGIPLVATDSHTLIGITSFALGSVDCVQRYATAFSRITSYRQWILDNAGV